MAALLTEYRDAAALDRDRAEGVLGGAGGGDDLLGVGHVQYDRYTVAAERLDLGGEFLELVDPAGGHRDVGAGGGQGQREAPPQPRRGAGDQGDLTGQIHRRVRQCERCRGFHPARPPWSYETKRLRR